jgi:hypothetical protein
MNELTEDWPADPDNDELVRFAEQLRAGLPALSPQVMARIDEKVQAALDRQQRRQRRRRLAVHLAVAAAILLLLSGVGGYFWTRTRTHDNPPIANFVQHTEPALVEDRITVAAGSAGNMHTVDKPLLRLDEYKSLFSN